MCVCGRGGGAGCCSVVVFFFILFIVPFLVWNHISVGNEE